MSGIESPSARRAVVVQGTEVVVVREQLSPLAEGRIRIELHYAGICHSDIAAIAAGQIAEPSHRGHEAAGVVVESRDPAIPVGARVVAYVDDGYASHVDAPAERLVVIDDGCSMLDAALAEPLACAIGGVEMLSLTDADEVVVVGAGFMGLLAVRYLALLGHRVTVVEPIAGRGELSIAAGAARAVEPAEAAGLYPAGTAVVIEASGAAAGLSLAGELVSIDGTLGVLGYHQSAGGMRTVPMESWNYRALTVRSLHHRDPARVLRWIDRAQRSAARGAIVPSAFVDALVPLDDAGAALGPQPPDRAPVKAVFELR